MLTFLSLPVQGKIILHLFLQLFLMAFPGYDVFPIRLYSIRRAKELKTIGLHLCDKQAIMDSVPLTVRDAGCLPVHSSTASSQKHKVQLPHIPVTAFSKPIYFSLI